MTDEKLSDNQIALLMRLEGGELDRYDFKSLPDELQHAFHELWSVNSKQGHDHVEIEYCQCKCGQCDNAFYSINDNGLAALGKPRTNNNDEQFINRIHPDLMESVKKWCPDNVEQINSYTYQIFDATFVVSGRNVTVGDVIGFLLDNGWERETSEDDS